MTVLGEALRLALEEKNWTQTDLSDVLGRPIAHVNALVNGGKHLTPESAVELSQAFGNDPMDWVNLDIKDRLSKGPHPDAEGIARRRAAVEARLKSVGRLTVTEIAGEIVDLAGRLQESSDRDATEAIIEALREKVHALPRRRYQREYHRTWRQRKKEAS